MMDIQENPEAVHEKMDRSRVLAIEKSLKQQMSKWLFGLDDVVSILTRAVFTLVPYTDSLTATKKLKQPNALLFGGTGIGKTDLINALFMAIRGVFSRVQGEPSLMPDDIVGYDTLIETTGGSREIKFVPGPLLANGVLWDESNRATAKVKAVFIEAGEESAVTLKSPFQGKKRIPLWPISGDINDINGPRFFMLLATQNIFGEEEGTFPNPMAELDRYSFSIFMNDPENPAEEEKINALNVVGKKIEPVTDLPEVLRAAQFIYEHVSIPEHTRKYMTALIRNTRPHRVQGEAAAMVKKNVLVGASPRVNFHLEAFARTEAFFSGDDVVKIEHIKRVAEMVLAHRLVIQEGMDFAKSREEICREIIREVLEQTDTGPWS